MKLKDLQSIGSDAGSINPMPLLFLGHGSPMNAIEENEFSRGWRDIARSIPRPSAVLCISAHWETWGTLVTAMEKPRTIHDFGGFPKELYDVQYPAPGSPSLAREAVKSVTKTEIGFDNDWGFDHGSWSVLKHMFPGADVPVVQMSLDYTKAAKSHYELAQDLAPLRRKGVLVLGSGNIVHNLRRIVVDRDDPEAFRKPFGLDWALEASRRIKSLIDGNDHTALIDYPSLGSAVQLAVPTPEHYLPLLYVLALKEENEAISYFNDQPVAGSLTMTSLIVEHAGKHS